MHPFNQITKDGVIYRTFNEEVDTSELIWHRDMNDRSVSVIESNGWLLQYEDNLPIQLVEGNTYNISAKSWHRIIKGVGPLKIIIKE